MPCDVESDYDDTYDVPCERCGKIMNPELDEYGYLDGERFCLPCLDDRNRNAFRDHDSFADDIIASLNRF